MASLFFQPARHWLFVVTLLALSKIVPVAAVTQAIGTPSMVYSWGTREYPGNPLSLTAVGDTVFFGAKDSRGWELWKSDGTMSGTVLVKEIQPGFESSSPDDLVNVNGMLFFSAYQRGVGRTLWKSDGTEAGTVMVKDFDPYYESQPSFDEMTNVNGILFFLVDSMLWRSDGTEAGTKRLLSNPLPGFLVNLDGLLIFANDDPDYGRELWRSDGTVAGTTLIMDLNPGPGHGVCYQTPLLTNVDGTLFFAGNEGVHGCELWQSDGTATGIQRLTDINPGPAHASDPLTGAEHAKLVAIGKQLFFYADDGVHGRELWRYDRTSRMAQMMKDIFPGSETSYGFDLKKVNDILLFFAQDSMANYELWRSDGTPIGTMKVKEINPGSGFHETSGPILPLPQEHIALFGADDGSTGTEVWKTDGTAAGTTRVADIASSSKASVPRFFTAAGNHVFFTADDGSKLGRQLWVMTTSPPPPEPSLTVTGELTAAMNERSNFIASVHGQIEQGVPITYIWRASGLYVLHQTNTSSDTASFTWTAGGNQFVTVTARQGEHILGGTTVAVEVQEPSSPITVTINGPTMGGVTQPLAFTVQLSHSTMQLPISYRWEATDQTTLTHSSTVSDTKTYTWDTVGQKNIIVTASSDGVLIGTVSHTITIVDTGPDDPQLSQHKIFLPSLVSH